MVKAHRPVWDKGKNRFQCEEYVRMTDWGMDWTALLTQQEDGTCLSYIADFRGKLLRVGKA